MIVKIDKSLEKDVRKLKEGHVKTQLAGIITEIRKAAKLADIPNLKKLSGTRNYYRIRIGDYRLGLLQEGEEIHLIRLLHRKEVYKYFP